MRCLLALECEVWRQGYGDLHLIWYVEGHDSEQEDKEPEFGTRQKTIECAWDFCVSSRIDFFFLEILSILALLGVDVGRATT